MKTVIVGSTNPVKLEVAREAFNWVFPTEEFEFITEAAVSGVPDQPFGLEETKRGATNRAKSCRAAFPLADYCVGLEGGIEEIDGEYWPSAWMCVEDRSGLCSYGKTTAKGPGLGQDWGRVGGGRGLGLRGD